MVTSTIKIILLLMLSFSVQSAPVKISNINVKQTTGFYVNTTTDKPSHMRVMYGTSPTALKNSVVDFVYRTSHHVDIDGLNFGTKYFYQIFVSGRDGARDKTKVLFYITERK